MRLLHTSDWHLGRSLHGVDLLQDQACYIDHLVHTVETEQVDAVVVSGDVYDRALPPVDAVQVADEAFARLAATRARVVVSAGNHDSASRLGFNSRLVDAAGVFFRTRADDCGTPVLLQDAHGPVAVYPLPYLEPNAVRQPWQLRSRSHQAALTEAMSRVRADLAARPAGTRSVVMSHAFVAGAEASDSERDISVGGVSLVPRSVFDGVDYTALGHLHGRHTLSDTVRYSGSALAYSFSERDHRKGSWLVDLDDHGTVATEFVEAPVPRPLSRLRGELDTLVSDPALADREQHWVHAVLTDPVRPSQAMDRLRARFPHTLTISFEPSGPQPPGESVVRPVTGRTDHQVALDFIDAVRGAPATQPESDLLQRACEAGRAAEDPQPGGSPRSTGPTGTTDDDARTGDA